MSKLEHSEGRMPGLLTHFKAAAVAAALVPLASFVAPAAAQEPCPGGVITGFIWYDANGNGIQDDGNASGIIETPVIIVGEGAFTGVMTDTDETGHYSLCLPAGAPDNLNVVVILPEGFTGATSGPDDDADGFDEGDSTATPPIPPSSFAFVPPGSVVDFGFTKPASVSYPGTGTPGYWKNHPEAWPTQSIVIGGLTYSKAEAIGYLNDGGSNKWNTIFSSLLSAKLNVMLQNPSTCVDPTIALADAWMSSYAKGANVKASSAAWRYAEPLHRTMDNYNNGMMCAPHRN